eukprot:TRINITY_DN30287_c0_g1_i1.p1 TRINITY_DN30287_c0_g1~~TRINITY_DN30287_c0_g1_i1.p1  ORF type:complete len:315 (-),score=55.39 TRINITY_DN30287_c0_g1_i1:28-972(-)
MKSDIECGVPDDGGGRIYQQPCSIFERDVDVFTAVADPQSRMLYKAGDLTRHIGCSHSRLGMYLKRRSEDIAELGLFKAKSFNFRPEHTLGLRSGGYFLTEKACMFVIQQMQTLDKGKEPKGSVISSTSSSTSVSKRRKLKKSASRYYVDTTDAAVVPQQGQLTASPQVLYAISYSVPQEVPVPIYIPVTMTQQFQQLQHQQQTFWTDSFTAPSQAYVQLSSHPYATAMEVPSQQQSALVAHPQASATASIPGTMSIMDNSSTIPAGSGWNCEYLSTASNYIVQVSDESTSIGPTTISMSAGILPTYTILYPLQ